MKTIIFTLFIFAVFSSCTANPKPPVIDPALASEFWRAQSRLLEIKPAFDKANAEIKSAMDKLVAICGKDYIVADDNGLKCVLKPKEVEKKK